MDLKLRHLTVDDHEKYNTHINSNNSKEYFTSLLFKMKSLGTYLVLEIDNVIVASGSLLIENKHIHGGCMCGHIEDIFTSVEHRGKGYAQMIIDALILEAKNNGCYRVNLLCTDNLTYFYQDKGFECSEQNAMSIKFPENFGENH